MADTQTGELPGIDAVPPELLKGGAPSEGGGEGGGPSTFSNILDDIGTGITEAPGAVVRGAAGAVAETGQAMSEVATSAKQGAEAARGRLKDQGGMGGAIADVTGFLPDAASVVAPIGKGIEWAGEKVKSAIGDRTSVTGGLIENVSQFVTGFIGAGKFTRLKGVGGGMVKGAMVDAIAFDPNQERLSNLVEQYPTFANPITEVLAAEKDDSSAVGRLKNAAEGLLIGGALEALIATVRGARALKKGDVKEAQVQAEVAETALKQASNDGPIPGPDIKPASLPEGFSIAENNGMWSVKKEGDEAHWAVGRSKEDAEASFWKSHPEQMPGQPKTADEALAQFDEATGYTGQDNTPVGKVEVATPGLAPKVRTTQEEVDGLISTLTKDAEALDQYGSREAAEAAGHKFAPRSDHFLPQGSTPEDILTAIDAAADIKAKDFAKLRGGDPTTGVQSWKDVAQDARDIAELSGTSPETVLQTLNRQASEADQMAAQIVYRRALYQGVGDQVMQLAKQRAYGVPGTFGSMEALDAEFARMIGFMADFSAKAGAIESNIARALNVMKGGKLFDPKAIFGENADMGEIAATIMASGGDWIAVGKTARKLTGPRPGDKFLSFAMANMLSGPETHLINVAGNMSHAAMIPTSKITGGLSDGLFATLRGDMDGAADGIRYAKEGYQQIIAMASMWRSSLKLARDAFWFNRAIADPLATKLTDVKATEVGGFSQGGKVDPVRDILGAIGDRVMMVRENPVSGSLENLWDLQQTPLRLLQSEDEFFKQLVSRSNIVARAQVEGAEAGLKGPDLKGFVAKKLEDAFDANTGMLKDPEALLEAREATFTDKLSPGTFAVKAQGLINHNVVSRLLIAPFFSTLANIIGAGVRYTPGANYALLSKYREAIKAGGDARRKAIGQAYVGGAFWGLAINEALEGRVTGPGPTNQQQRMALEGTGWRPYSYVINRDDGSRSYIPLNVFDPLGMIFTMAAEASSIAKGASHGQYDSISEAGVATSLAIARVMENRSMFQNLSGIFDLMSKRDEASLSKVLAGQVRMAIPGVSAMNVANRYDDPDMRQAQTMWERIKRGIPGMSDDMAVRANFIGEPVEKQARLMTTQKGDPVTRELVRAIQIESQAFQAPSAYLTERGMKVDLRRVQLADGTNAYTKYMEFVQNHPGGTKTLREEMEQLIKSKSYKDAKDGNSRERGSKLYRLAALRGRFQKQAAAALKRQYPEVRAALMESKEKNDRLRAVRDSLLSEGDNRYLHGDEQMEQPGAGNSAEQP